VGPNRRRSHHDAHGWVALAVALFALVLLLHDGAGVNVSLNIGPFARAAAAPRAPSFSGLPIQVGPAKSTRRLTVFIPPTEGTGQRSFTAITLARHANILLSACIGPGNVTVAIGAARYVIPCQGILYEDSVRRRHHSLTVTVDASRRQHWLLAAYGATTTNALP